MVGLLPDVARPVLKVLVDLRHTEEEYIQFIDKEVLVQQKEMQSPIV